MMKLVILFALFALASARVDVFEPISMDPAIIDFNPDAVTLINKEKIREALVRILEYLKNLAQKPDWGKVRDFLVSVFEKKFPNGLPRPPRPNPVDLEDFSQWLEKVMSEVVYTIPRPPRPPQVALEALKNWWNELERPSRPVTLESFKKFIRNAIDTFPRPPRPVEDPEPIEIPEPVEVPESAPSPASSPLVQIIVNVQNAASGVASALPTPVHFVDDAE